MFNNEIWKDIDGYESIYEISNLGRVRFLKFKKIRILRNEKDVNGYLRVTLRKDGIKKRYKVHRLVAQAFIPNPNNLPQVNHKDEDKTNNRVENLEWCDAKYNMNYGTARKRMVEKIQKVVIQIDKNTNVIVNIFPSAKEAKIQTGICHISSCCRNERKTAGGYKWKYQQKERH